MQKFLAKLASILVTTVVAANSVLAGSAAHAQTINSAADLAAKCGSPSSADRMDCAVTIAMQLELAAALAKATTDGKAVCQRPGTSMQDLRMTFDKWARAHPDQLQMPAARAILIALGEAYPC